MKYGNFVGTGTVPFSTDEYGKTKESLVEQVKDVCPRFTVSETVMGSEFLKELKFIHIDFVNPVVGRNTYKERVDVEGLVFCVEKKTGYLEVEDSDGNRKADYGDAPEFDYAVSIYFDGIRIPYRHREGIRFRTEFLYGTEIGDLKISPEYLRYVKESLTLIK